MDIDIINSSEEYDVQAIINALDPYSKKEILKNKLLSKVSKNTKSSYRNDAIAGNDFQSTSKSDTSFAEYIDPEYDHESLGLFPYLSDSLYACIETLSINICGNGHEFLEEKETFERKGKKYYKKTGKKVEPEVVQAMNEQLSRITMFFESVSLDMPWLLMQKLKMKSKHTTGDAYLEVERGYETLESKFPTSLQGLKLVEPAFIRLTKRSDEIIKVTQLVKNPVTLEFEKKTRGKRFRKFIQLQGGYGQEKKYFKEFNDPRVMNAYTGEYLKDESGNYYTNDYPIPEGIVSKLEKEGQKFALATEIWHSKIHNINDLDGHGVPVWACLIPMLLGLKCSDLTDYETLKNKGIPEYLMIIEGGNASSIIKAFQDDVKENLKNDKRKSFLIVSADSKNTGTNTEPNYKNPSIRIEPLNQLLSKEGLKGKTEYRKEVNRFVDGVFRLPSAYRGELHNINRSSLETAVDSTNQNVFGPERTDEDNMINMLIMPELGSQYYRYHSKSAKMENPELKLQAVKDGTMSGSMLPGEARGEYSEILGKNYQDIDIEFMNTPYPVSIRKTTNTPSITPSSVDNSIIDNEPTDSTNNSIDDNSIDNKPAKISKNLFILEDSENAEVYKSMKNRIEDEFKIKIKEMAILAI